MSFRTVYITNPCTIKVKNGQLVIRTDADYEIPAEDIEAMIIENRQIRITASVVDKLLENDALIYWCDEKHLPSGITIPFAGHYKKAEAMNNQLNLSRKAAGRIWQKIIRQKIINQANIIRNIDGVQFEIICNLARDVEEFDVTHREGFAARLYFQTLFGETFKRREESILNGALNYGYSIIRGAIARDVSAHGFETSFGLFHHSALNAFNLADDLIEPFRPIVDQYVYNHINDLHEELSASTKSELVSVLNTRVQISNQSYTVLDAVHLMIKSLAGCYRRDSAAGLILPAIIFKEI